MDFIGFLLINREEKKQENLYRRPIQSLSIIRRCLIWPGLAQLIEVTEDSSERAHKVNALDTGGYQPPGDESPRPGVFH